MIDFPASPTTNQIFTVSGASWRYNGASWAAYTGSLVGDITSVVAGTGLTGGGTSGDVTLNLATPVSIANGGTGATTAPAALTNLGAAPTASPTFTGTVTIPPGASISGYAPLASPVFTGDPQAPTPATADNDTSVATTAFVKAQGYVTSSGVTSITAGTGLTGGTISATGTIGLSVPVSIANGGTGATTTAGAPWLPLTGGQLNPGGLLVGTAGTVPGTGSLTLNANTVAPPTGIGPTNIYVVGADTAGAIFTGDAFGTNQGTVFQGRAARGTAAVPAACQAGDLLAGVFGWGRRATDYSGYAATIRLQAAETWSGTQNGSNIVFATTPSGTTATVNSLTLAGNSATFSGQIIAQQAAGQGIGINIITSAADATIYFSGSPRTWVIGNQLTSGGFYIFDNTGGQTRLTIDTTGACKNTTGTWSTISDTRAKTNIEPYDAGLQAVLALKPIRYDLATDDWQGEGLVGFRAEEVATVLPELCGTAMTKLKGKDTEMQTVAPTGVVFALVNAIKELKAEIDSLKAQLAGA